MADAAEQPSEYEERVTFFGSGLVEPNDFALQCNDFLDKMKQSSAFELVKSIKKFINNFIQQQQPRPIEERVDEIRQFLDDTSLVIERHPLWKYSSEEEIEIAAEALERYTMHKVHKSVYSPSREDDARRDREFLQQLESLSFITPSLLDIPLSGPTCEAGWEVSSNQLKKMESCKSPRDKVACVMNLFTVLCKLLVEVQSGTAAGADDLMPNVIYIILRAKPAHWYSDVRYIQRFRHPGRLSSEAGYYMTQMMGAVAFLEKIEAHHLSMSEDDFRKARRGEYMPVPKMAKRKAKRKDNARAEVAGLEAQDGATEADATASAAAEPGYEDSIKSDDAAVRNRSSVASGSSTSLHSNASTSSTSRHGNASPSSRRSSSSASSQPEAGTPKSGTPAATASPSSSPHTQTRRSSSSGGLVPIEPVDAAPSSLPAAAAATPASSNGLQVRRIAAMQDSEGAANSLLSPLASVSVSPVQEAGIVERYLDCKFKEMTVGDFTELLKNYRVLVHKYCTLRAQLATQTATTAHAQLQQQVSHAEVTPSAAASSLSSSREHTPPTRHMSRSVSQPSVTMTPPRKVSLWASGSGNGEAAGSNQESASSVFISNPTAL